MARKTKVINQLPLNTLSFNQSLLDNNQTYNDYLDRMMKICLSIFEWRNLPKSMDARFLERCLFFNGQASLLYDETFGFINTMVSSNGDINLYGLPTSLNCYSYGGAYHDYRKLFNGLVESSEEAKNTHAILVMNNWERIPTASTIQLFAERLTLAQRTCDINIQAQRTPILILGNDKQKLMLENLFSQYDGNKPVIYGDKDQMSADMIKGIDTKAPYVADKVKEYQKEIWNEFLEFIGVNNVSVDKKERLITGEANANNEVINLNLQSYLAPRQKACDEFNRLFGLEGENKISVKVRSDLTNIIKMAESVVNDYTDDGIINGSVGDSNE